MRGHAFAAAVLLTFAGTAAAQIRIAGAVTSPDGAGRPTPVSRAYVLARSGEPPRVVAEAETDGQGRYVLTGLPAGRVTLSVEAQGYYTVRAGGLEAASIARSCPQEGDCGETDFELGQAAVIEGWLTDSYGDPYQDIQLELRQESASNTGPGDRMRGPAGHATSDDRGYFRMWGVKPGAYELTLRQWGFGGPPVELEKQAIEIAPGQTEHQARIALKTDANVFSISGEVVGLDAEALERRAITIQGAGAGDPSYWTSFHPLREGKFSVPGLRTGEYVLKLVDDSGEGRRWTFLDTLTVDRDLTGLQLSLKPPTGVRGRVEFVESEPSDLYLGVGPPANRGFTRDGIEAKGPDYAFEHEGIPPGDYEIALRNQGYYLIERTLVTVQLGRMQDLTLRVSNVRSTVRGTARVSEGDSRQAAAHFTVVMRSDRARYKIQTDDSGGFALMEVIPGEYEIAAFESADVDVDDEEAWERAKEHRKRLMLEAGFETEIDLTVTR
jgi:hypothetical protein